MKHITKVTILISALAFLNACDRNDARIFNEIYELTDQKNLFKARELFESDKVALSKPYKKYFEAVIDNAFNDPESSDKNIESLLKNESSIPDSLRFKLYETKYDNALKQYNYSEAVNTVKTILSNYKEYLDDEQAGDYENSLKIWTALENTPRQTVEIKGMVKIKMKKDIAGLNTLKIVADNDSSYFIFDTGANLSTTTMSVSEKLKMTIIPIDIEVGTITGSKVMAMLAVCDTLIVDNIELHNVVFLVLPDEALSVPQINYQINGVLGFPVIEAMKEIRITRNGDFIVPLATSSSPRKSNLAMDGLTPLVQMNGKHFSFDTGADHTILYQKFYLENQKGIDENYQPEKISFGGAGGQKSFEGYKIDYTFNIGEKQINLENISLLKEKIKESETVYGNIGQDLIQKFDTMIISFDQMFIRFE